MKYVCAASMFTYYWSYNAERCFQLVSRLSLCFLACIIAFLLFRIEYDAYRTDLEELNLGPRDASTLPKIEQSQHLFQIHKEKYDKMRSDVSVKLKFLEENKVNLFFAFWKLSVDF